MYIDVKSKYNAPRKKSVITSAYMLRECEQSGNTGLECGIKSVLKRQIVLELQWRVGLITDNHFIQAQVCLGMETLSS